MKAAASSVKSKAASTGENVEKTARKGVRKETASVGGSLLKRALIAGARRSVRALVNAGSRGLDSLIENAHRLPIQRSIDVAVPLEIAWEQWMELSHLPEGTHRLLHVQRNGDELSARIDGLRGAGWSAEVIDERE